jgi:outer membrane protein TolC
MARPNSIHLQLSGLDEEAPRLQGQAHNDSALPFIGMTRCGGLILRRAISLPTAVVMLWIHAAEPALARTSSQGNSDPTEQILADARSLLNDAKRVSMKDAISSSLRHNPSLQAAYSAIQASQWQLSANKRRWFPTASVDASPGSTFLGKVFETDVANYPNSQPGSYATNTYNSSYRSYTNTSNGSIGLLLSWSFFDLSRQSAINSASARLKAETLTFNVVARSLVLQTQMLYQTLQETERLIKTYEHIHQINEQQLRLIQAQYRVGMTNIGDVYQKKSQLLNQLTKLIFLYRDLARTASELASSMGKPPGSAVLPTEPATSPAAWGMSLDETISTGLRLREEIQISLSEAAAAQWDAQGLVETYLPVLMLNGTAFGGRGTGTYDATVGEDPSPYFSRQYTTNVGIGLGLRWNFYDGGVRNAEAQRAEAISRERRSQAASDRISVADQIRRSYASYEVARLGMPSATQAVEAANASVEVANRRYEVGLGTIADLIQAVALLGKAAQNQADLQLTYSNAIAELYRYSAEWPANNKMEIEQSLNTLVSRPQ